MQPETTREATTSVKLPRRGMLRLDLNSDLGESSEGRLVGDDDAILDIVTSANIACGFHAGDAPGIRETCRRAVERGVVIGAHVGYRDFDGFGRRDIDVHPRTLVAEIIYQIGALRALAEAEGGRVAYVKPHGALYNRIVHDTTHATAVVEAVIAAGDDLVLMGLPGSASLRVAQERGLLVVHEAFADRAYRADGTLVPRSESGAVIHDPDVVARRIVTLATTGTLAAVGGERMRLEVDSICVHGDTPDAVSLARAVREALDAEGVTVAPAIPTVVRRRPA